MVWSFEHLHASADIECVMGFQCCVRCVQSKQRSALAQGLYTGLVSFGFTHPFDWEDRRPGYRTCRRCIMTTSAEQFDIV